MMKMDFTTFEVMEILGISRGKLREWMNSLMIKPSIEEATGRGTASIFSRWDVYGLAIMNRHLGSPWSTLTGFSFFQQWQDETRDLSLEERHNIHYIKFSCVSKEFMPGALHESYYVDYFSTVDEKVIADIDKYSYSILIGVSDIIKTIDSRDKVK